VLAALGVIVGLVNITAEDTRGFLLAAIALALSATALNTIPVAGKAFELILPFVVAFVSGATIVVALKELLLPPIKDGRLKIVFVTDIRD
jgi:zinc transporter ZupT